MDTAVKRICIFKQGALGDIIKALGAFEAIRQLFPGSHLTLITSPAYEKIVEELGIVDGVLLDPRSRNPLKWLTQIWHWTQMDFDLVIDLQHSRRTSRYYTLWQWFSKTPWSGPAQGCTYQIPTGMNQQVPVGERFCRQMNALGGAFQQADLQPQLPQTIQHRLDQSVQRMMPGRYALILPGCSPKSLEKRWPAEYYAQVCSYLVSNGIVPVLIGGPVDQEPIQTILSLCPGAMSLAEQLDLLDLPVLAKKSEVVIGNDTGPLYLCELAHQPTIVLWGGHSNPHIHGPTGDHATILFEKSLENLSVDRVLRTLQARGVGPSKEAYDASVV
jgi:ADP-heptose:LPS heptosyltransferase